MSDERHKESQPSIVIVDEDDAPEVDERFMHNCDMFDRYTHMRDLLAAIKDMSDYTLPTVDQCDEADFVALDKVRDVNRLQKLNPFPIFNPVSREVKLLKFRYPYP